MDSPHVPRDLPETFAANREELRRRSRAERVRPIWLWIGIVTGPVAFAVVRIAGIILIARGCGQATGTHYLGLTPQAITAGITVMGALATLVAGAISWRIWHETRLPEDEVSAEDMPRVTFWALGGTLMSAFFLIAIAITGVLALALSGGCP